MPGAFLALLWLTWTNVLLFLPQHTDPVLGYTIANFNFTVVVVGGVLVLIAINWYLPKFMGGARHTFTGPSAMPEE